MNIALISCNVIRISQVVGNYYKSKGNKIYHFLITQKRRLDYPVEGNVVYVKKNGYISSSDFISFVESAYDTAAELRYLKKKYSIDVSISFQEMYNILNVLSKGREKCIVSVRTTLSHRNDLTGYEYNKHIISLMYNLSDYVVTAGEYAKEDLIKHYHIRRSKVKAIPNPAIRYPNISNSSWGDREKVVVSVTRFDPIKQVEHIIRAFSYLYSKDSDVKLLLIGDGKEKGYLQSLACRYHIEDSVIFAGYKSDVGGYLRNARLFVMTSRVEGFPNAMVEAMACGVPIVTTDTPGSCGEILGERRENDDEVQYCEFGILTPYMAVRAPKNDMRLTREEIILGRAMLEVIKNDEIYNRYVERSLLRAKDYEFSKVMQKWDEIVF